MGSPYATFVGGRAGTRRAHKYRRAARPHYRGSSNNVAFYMPGDASGSGFGSALIRDKSLVYEAGTWSGDWRAESSNFREADNLVSSFW